MMLIPRASVAWQYAFGETNPATSLAFSGIPGSNFSVTVWKEWTARLSPSIAACSGLPC
jgi:hypothetical protein